MVYSGTMYVCLNEDEPHIGHQWTNPVGDRVLCPGVTADEVIKHLRAQLQQAQEERENRESLLAQTTEAMEQFAAERDAAIERGKLLWWEAKREIQVQVALVVALLEVAEATEADAKAKGALAEVRLEALHEAGCLGIPNETEQADWTCTMTELPQEKWCSVCRAIVMTSAQLVSVYDIPPAEFIAEALSPQGVQKEDD